MADFIPNVHIVIVGILLIGSFLGSGIGLYKVKDVSEERDQLVDFYLDEKVQVHLLEMIIINATEKNKHIVILERLIKHCNKRDQNKKGQRLTIFCQALTGYSKSEDYLLREKLRRAEKRAEALSYENARLKTMLQDPKRTFKESEENR